MSPLKNVSCINALTLKVLAMCCMLLDHMWATLIPGAPWMTVVGRLAFPIFAFQIVEGYAHTRNVKKYLMRLLVFALVSEVPFNLMASGSILFPFHQNVMFTFLEALALVWLLDCCRQKNTVLFAVMIPVAGALGFVLGQITMVDYYGLGVLTVLIFYLSRDLKWGWLLQLAGLYIINARLMGGMEFGVSILGQELNLSQQAFAILSLIPIWLYNGKQGPHSKAIQYACYAFYPVHILVLALLARTLT